LRNRFQTDAGAAQRNVVIERTIDFIKAMDKMNGFKVPALKMFDSKALSMWGIEDSMATMSVTDEERGRICMRQFLYSFSCLSKS
jgi:hypothetical protein